MPLRELRGSGGTPGFRGDKEQRVAGGTGKGLKCQDPRPPSCLPPSSSMLGAS